MADTLEAATVGAHARRRLQAYRQGDHLSDEDLRLLASDMQLIAVVAGKYGNLFELPTVYARQVARNCFEYLEARQRAAREQELQDWNV